MSTLTLGRPKDAKRLTTILGGAAFTFVFGLTAGLITTNVKADITEFRSGSDAGKADSWPKHLRRGQIMHVAAQDATIADQMPAYPPAPAVQAEAWFPANNHIVWHFSTRPGEGLHPLNINNAGKPANQTVIFYAATGDPTRPWNRAATLFVRAGQNATIQLPRGHYLAQRVTSHPQMPYNQVLQKPAVTFAQVPLGLRDSQRAFADQRTSNLPASYQSIRSQPRSFENDQEEYAGLVEAAIAGN